MANEKITFQIDADIKNAQKNIASLEKDFTKQSKALEKLRNDYRDTAKNVSKLDVSYGQVSKQFDKVSNKIKEYTDLQKRYNELSAITPLKRTPEQASALESVTAKLATLTAPTQKDYDTKDALQAKLKTISIEYDYQANKLQQIQQIGTQQNEDLRSTAQSIQFENNVLEQMQQSRQKLLELQEKQALAEETAKKNAEEVKQKSFSLAERMGVVAQKAKEFASAIGKKAISAPIVVLKKSFSGLLAPIKKVGKSFSNFGKMILRAAKWGLIFRPIRQAMSAVTESLTKALNNNKEFAASWANLKGTLLSAVTPAFNALVPVIAKIMNIIATLVTYIATLINLLFGLTKASKSSAKALSKAGKAGKEASLSLASWDTVQKLSQSGGGDTGTEPTFDQDWTKAEKALDKIKEKIASDDWFGVGMEVSKMLNDVIRQMDTWLIQKFYPYSENFAKNLADYLNGRVAGQDWELMGKTVADGLDGIVNAVATFFETFDGVQLGEGLGTGISKFIETFDFKRAAQGLSEFAIDVFDTIGRAIANVNWQELGRKTVEFVKNIKWGELAKSIFYGLGAALGGLAGFIWGIIQGAWESVVEWWNGLMEESGGNVIEALLLGIGKALIGIPKWIIDNIFEPFMEGFKKAFGIASPSTEMQTQGEFISEGMLEGIKNKLTNIGTWIKEHIFQPIWDGIKKAFGIESGESSEMKEAGKSISKGLASGITGAIDAVKSAINSIINWIETAINKVIDKINDLLHNAIFEKGAELLGKELPELKHVSLPRLAQGAVVNPNHEFAAILGDNRREQEIVSPLSTMKQALTEALAESNFARGGNITLQVDGKTFARIVNPYLANETTRIGTVATGGR